MEVYIFRADLLCKECGEQVCKELPKPEGMDPSNESTWDSDDYPKGTYPDGGGESDCPRHCAACGEFLENPLTSDGEQYVRGAFADDPDSEVVKEWVEFYDYLELPHA